MYLLTTPTACAISGLVQTIAYIKLPTAEAYGTSAMWSRSSAILGDCSFYNLKWFVNGVVLGLASLTLNLLGIFSMYNSWDRFKVSADLSREIFIPKICFAGPKSFISNVVDNLVFRLLIYLVLDPAINISSTFKSRKTYESVYFLKKQQGSFLALQNTLLVINESNFLYYFLGACFSPYKLLVS